MANWDLPDIDTDYLEVLERLAEKDYDSATMFYDTSTNTPEHAMRWRRDNLLFEELLSGIWTPKQIAIGGGGTGAATASGARTNLGLGTLAVQNASGVNITGGSISGVSITGLSATTAFSSGTVPTARLGSGLANASTFLAGDQSWKAINLNQGWAILAKSGPYTIVVADVNNKTVIYCNGTFQLDLPAANDAGLTVPSTGIRIINIGTGVITVVPTSGTIIGDASFELSLQWMSLEFFPQAVANNWSIF